MTVSGVRDIEIRNTLPTKITVFWTIAKHFDQNNSVFNVHPPMAHIKPGGSHIFSVTFRPIKNSYYFFQCLQLFATKFNTKLTEKLLEDAKNKSFQQNNTSKLESFHQTQKSKLSFVSDEMFPTLYANIRCVGHSFNENSQPFIPMIDVNPNDLVVFPPCTINESVYQCVELINKTDTPTYFKFSPDSHQVIFN